jgi:hypothetical protein
MLKELENLLAEIARQQGLEVGPRQPQPQPPQQQSQRAAAPRRPVVQNHDLVDAEIIEAEPVRVDIRSHVARTADTSDITQNIAKLGAQVGMADDRMGARLHERFDQKLSQIGEFSYEEPTDDKTKPSGDTAGQIADMFRDARTTRQAIILNEILTRPVDRW